jgi:hypothetical protein
MPGTVVVVVVVGVLLPLVLARRAPPPVGRESESAFFASLALLVLDDPFLTDVFEDFLKLVARLFFGGVLALPMPVCDILVPLSYPWVQMNPVVFRST